MPYINSDDVSIYYEIHGPETGEPLLLLEGWAQDSWMWFRQIPQFSKKYKCIVVDNRGVGKSSKPDYPYEMTMFAKDALQVLNQLQISKTHVLGISMGGLIAQEFTLSYPERVISLIMASTHFGGPNIINPKNDILAKVFAFQTETISKKQAYNMRMSVLASKEWLKENKNLTDQIEIWKDQNPQPNYAKLQQGYATSNFNAEERIGTVKAPTLIIQGDSDLVVPPKNAELLHEKIANSKLVMIKNGPHWSFITEYQQFNNIVMEFLENLPKIN